MLYPTLCIGLHHFIMKLKLVFQTFLNVSYFDCDSNTNFLLLKSNFIMTTEREDPLRMDGSVKTHFRLFVSCEKNGRCRITVHWYACKWFFKAYHVWGYSSILCFVKREADLLNIIISCQHDGLCSLCSNLLTHQVAELWFCINLQLFHLYLENTIL